MTNLAIFSDVSSNIFNQIHFFKKIREKFKKNKGKEEKRATIKTGLKANITMPTTGDEAMKRLLACKGKDPYSILGVTPTCTDDDIKRYYKRQAVLVHPDKNKQPGAEEAFKILVHAFDIIGEPEKRGNYDRGKIKTPYNVFIYAGVRMKYTQFTINVILINNKTLCSSFQSS